MTSVRISAAAAAIFVFVGMSQLSPARSFAADQVLTGELVVLEGSPNKFRLVDHEGSFAAPAGMSLEDLDGKPVRVEVSNGRVVQITQVPMQIEPVIHGFEEVSGYLVVTDANSGRFTLAGDTRSYAAPHGTDIRPYADKKVELRLDEHGQVTRIGLASAGTSAADAPLTGNCVYSGFSYSDGSPLCQNGTQFTCEHGKWRNLGTACR